MSERIDVVIIGGGQAGLSLSYYLTQKGRAHVVLERGRVAETWRSQRWDSFTLVTPNWMTQLPGFPYQGEDPDGFLPHDEIVLTLERYAQSFHAPLRCGVQATSVRIHPAGNGYLIETSDGSFEAANVVLATGGFPCPRLPQARFACHPDLSGKDGGHAINLRQLAQAGVVLLGRLQAVQGSQVILAPDLEENLAWADAQATQLTQAI